MSTTEAALNNSQIENLFSETFGADTYSAANIRKAFGDYRDYRYKGRGKSYLAVLLLFRRAILELPDTIINKFHILILMAASVTITIVSPD